MGTAPPELRYSSHAGVKVDAELVDLIFREMQAIVDPESAVDIANAADDERSVSVVAGQPDVDVDCHDEILGAFPQIQIRAHPEIPVIDPIQRRIVANELR